MSNPFQKSLLRLITSCQHYQKVFQVRNVLVSIVWKVLLCVFDFYIYNIMKEAKINHLILADF